MGTDPEPALQPIIRPPHGVYVADDDNIRLTVFNALAGVTLTLAGRFLHVDGRVEPFEHRLVPASDRTASSITRRLAKGWILNTHVYVSAAAPLTGQAFAIVSLVRGHGGAVTELATLSAGYVTATQRSAWPGSPILNALDGGGALRAIAGTTPAAAAQISETVPTGARWEVLAVHAQLLTSAVAANRLAYLAFDDGAAVLAYMPNIVNHPASQTFFYTWGQGLALPNLATNNVNTGALIVNGRLGAGHRIRTEVGAMQAGDQWSNVRLLVREWIEGA